MPRARQRTPDLRRSVTTVQVRNSGWKVNSAQLWRAWFGGETRKIPVHLHELCLAMCGLFWELWPLPPLQALVPSNWWRKWRSTSMRLLGSAWRIFSCCGRISPKYPSLSKLAWLHLSVPATQVSERGCSRQQIILSLLEENTFFPSMLSNLCLYTATCTRNKGWVSSA